MLSMFKNLKVPDLKAGDNRTIAKSLVAKGILQKARPEFTNRGILHLVVDCNVPYLTIRHTFPAATKDDEDLAVVEKHLEQEGWVNRFYYYKFKQHIEWDLFNQDHSLKKGNQKETNDFAMIVFERLVDDGTIPLEKILKLYGLPEHLLSRIDRSVIKEVFRMYKGI